MNIVELSRQYHDFQRLVQVLRILAQYGFDYLISLLPLEKSILSHLPGKLGGSSPDLKHMPLEVRIRNVAQALGPTYIKLGQILSTRPDLIPISLCRELEKLQDRVEPFEENLLDEIFEREFQSAPGRLFREFKRVPFAAASLSQVHEALLHTGEKAAVKIQRPGIRKTIQSDLEILMTLAALIQRHVEDVAHYDLTGIVSEFRKHVFRELDFSLEARNLNRFREHFRDVPEIVFPKVFSDLSTERVLAMEMIEGVNVRNIDLLRQKGFDCRSLALAGARAILKQVFEDGFFHADPHPGNLFILSDGRIAFIDAGMAARLDEETMGQLASLLYSIVKKDLHGIWRELVSMDVLDEFQDTRPLRLDLMDFIDHYVDRPLKEISAQKLLSEFTEIISKHHLQIPADMTLLIKCLITIEGIGRNLDPDFNLAEHATPYVEKWLRHRYSPSRMFKHFRNTFTDFLHLVKVFPRETRSILSQIRKGSLKIEFEHLGLDPALKVFSEISRRLSLALLLASLIIGSSLIVLSGIPPVWHGVPVIGIAGFLVSGILAVYLFFML